MKQLSGTDNSFLVSERKNVYNHVASLCIYDVSTAPGGKVRYKDILKHFEERMHVNPIFRSRLAEVPFGLDRPYWVEQADVDMEFHVRHIALPAPGDWRQLMIQVARLHSRPLDRTRPMWEVYVIEGLDNIPKLPPGSFALFSKFHHASVDGMAGAHLALQLHSTSPTGDAPTAAKHAIYVDREPSTIEFAARAVANNLGRVVQLGKLSAQVAGKVAEFGREQLTQKMKNDAPPRRDEDKPATGKAPHTRFNTLVSPNRVVDGFGMPLSRIKRVRTKIPGASLNDVFLAVSGGGVRKYLMSKHELPSQSLTALMPMALRTDASAGGNAVGAATVRVRSDIADPLERLNVAHHEAQLGKYMAEKLGADLLEKVLSALPSNLGRLIVAKGLIPTLNMTVSNVRGPDKPLYVAGAKAMCFYPVSIPMDGLGLNVTGVSYNGVMWVSVVSCRNMLPDPAFFVECLKDAWEELLAAADALPDPTGTSEKKASQTPVKRAVGKNTVTKHAPVKKPIAKRTPTKLPATKRPVAKKPAAKTRKKT
ncbi:MAG: wax ester/triacylglycerol synthase family O-acyltransferase [Rhodocyclaceae bacterium]|nr:wax ester/triacylglycerol synthase family O-acyltransferase [Rhodocyclaceae bacterium]